MVAMPTGTVTFLFSDLEGSTRLWQEHPDAMHGALARHDAILRDAVEAAGGHVVKMTGDGIHAAFTTAHPAIESAIAAQHALAIEPWEGVGPLRVRIGVHTGTAEHRDGDYYGTDVNRAARLMAAAHGGQILLSHASSVVLGDLTDLNVDGVTLIDLGEHRLRDLSRPERVFQVAHPSLDRDFAPLQSLDAFPGNLPFQLTSFIGRERLLERVTDALRDARVVTLTGVGGVGKTRLALQVAGEVLPHYRDGAWLCELAGVRDGNAIPDAVAAVFDVRPKAGQELTESLVEFFRTKELLLVLDNCEHVVQPVARLVTTIERTCRGVQVLATSREGLDIDGERILIVSSLDVPAEHADLDTIDRSAAVRLFVERARAAKADFALTAANAEAVAQLCRRLDGIALAIELAAARVSTFTPAELASRLDHRFRVLTGGRRTAVERHQTLRAAVDWSYDLLDEPEQRVADRLAVFVGGFTLEAAEAVVGGAGVDGDRVWELLDSLVRKSLVVVDDDATETRYRLLETIRQYTLERLDESGDTDRVRHEHARYYTTFAEAAVPGLAGRDEVAWTVRLDRELDNVRAALEWAVDAGDADTAARLLSLSAAPSPTWLSGFNRTVDPFAEVVLDIPGIDEHPQLAAAMTAASWLAYNRGDIALSARRYDDAAEAEVRLGSEPNAYLRIVYANLAAAEGDLDEATKRFEQGVAIYRERDDPARVAPTALLSTMRPATGTGDAREEAEEALALGRQIGGPSGLALALVAAGAAIADTDPQRALALAREAVALEDSVGRRGGGYSLALAADLAARHGSRRDALELFAKAIEELHWVGGGPLLPIAIAWVGGALAADDPETAAVLLGAAESLPSPMGWAGDRGVEEFQLAVDTVTTALGEARAAELRARGGHMDEEEAVVYTRAAISTMLESEQDVDG